MGGFADLSVFRLASRARFCVFRLEFPELAVPVTAILALGQCLGGSPADLLLSCDSRLSLWPCLDSWGLFVAGLELSAPLADQCRVLIATVFPTLVFSRLCRVGR